MVRKAACDLKALVPAAVVAVGMMTAASGAEAQTRALKLYNTHTHEKQTIVFKRGGRYDASGLKKINHMLRDWRRNEPTRMDPRLIDLVWEVYQKSGSRAYIHIVSGYRSPGTNKMLKSRSRRSGVAEKSQHILGKAMDFYIPDVPLKKLREIGMKFQVGGVGFYPTSGSPFVHMDVGGVRAWPRMPRRELTRLFPDGKTLHVPAEGGTMPGYQMALADYKRRVGKDSIVIAGTPSTNSDSETRERKSLLAALFSRADEDEGDFNDVPETVVEKPKTKPVKEEQPEEVLVAAAEEDKVKAPVPRVRPAYAEESETLKTALFSTKKNPAEDAMKAALTPQLEALENGKAEEEAKKPEFSDLAQYNIPVPQILGDRRRPGDSQGEDVLMASAEALDSAASANLVGVPVPELRPADEKPLVTAAVENDDADAPAPELTAQEIAALARESGEELIADMRTDQDEVAGMIDSLDNADKADNKVPLAEMASLDVPKASLTRGIVIPASLPMDDVAQEEPKRIVKGARIKTDKVSKDSIRVEPKLTQNLIAKWALTNGRNRIIAKPVKAPRFVSRTMRKQPTEVYVDGFSRDTAQVDPDRFSGSAVNFMPVKKFDN